MKIGYYLMVLIVFGCMVTLSLAADNQDVPALFVAEPEFRFDPVVSGQSIIHDYILQNKGTANLEITSIKTG